MEPIRLLVVDDQELLRRGLRMLLESTGQVQVLGEAINAADALGQIRELGPDAVLTDLVMPGGSGVELIERCGQLHPDLPVVVVTTFDTEELVTAAIDAGAAGFLLKDTSPEAIVAAIESARRGEVTIDPRVTGTLLRRRRPPRDPLDALTGAERHVAELIAAGRTNGEIATELHLAMGTVKNYVSTVLRKLDQRDRTQLALLLNRAAHLDKGR